MVFWSFFAFLNNELDIRFLVHLLAGAKKLKCCSSKAPIHLVWQSLYSPSSYKQESFHNAARVTSSFCSAMSAKRPLFFFDVKYFVCPKTICQWLFLQRSTSYLSERDYWHSFPEKSSFSNSCRVTFPNTTQVTCFQNNYQICSAYWK